LTRHDPAAAVKCLQHALEACPAWEHRSLYAICFYLGIALRRLGFVHPAVKSWIACQRLNKRGHTRKLLSRYLNSYGMERQASSEADDRQAFIAIQLGKYLLCKNRHAFSTEAERDMIGDLILDSWKDLRRSGSLEGKGSCEKMELFRSTRIVFPTVVLTEPSVNGPVISVNFQTKQKVGLKDRCACGSGLVYMSCCGRTPAKDELLSGLF
jgi:hypothetical protein